MRYESAEACRVPMPYGTKIMSDKSYAKQFGPITILDILRLQECGTTNTNMTSTFVQSIEKKSIIDTG